MAHLSAIRQCLTLSFPSTHIARAAYAGHSKWQNIRHVKAANDQRKSVITVRLMAKVRFAVRTGGGGDPKSNGELSRAIAEALANDVPKHTIDNAIKNALSNQEAGVKYVVEAKGPGGCFFMIDCFTDKPRMTRDSIQNVLKKFGGSVLDTGSISFAFNEKGIVSACKAGVSANVAEEDAIVAGAEEVEEIINENGKTVFQFICDPQSLNTVRDAIHLSKYTVVDATIGYVPSIYQRLSEDQQEVAAACIDKLEETVEPLRKIYNNIEAA